MTKEEKSAYYKQWREKNKENKLLADRAYKEANRAKINAQAREYAKKNKDKTKAKYMANREAELEKARLYREANRDKIKQYVLDNPDKIKASKKKYRDANKDKDKAYREANKAKRNERQKANRVNNPLLKLKDVVRGRILKILKHNGFKKLSRTEQILGCTYEQFRLYIEAKFEPWMNWNNHGLYNGSDQYGWDLDHIIPLSSATNKAELLALFHYTNQQPLCSHINRDIKKNNIQ
jgi:hypothetical protein